MALETATYIDGLVATNPAASDAISTADDHLRLIKSTIKATFPNITGPVTLSQSQIAPLASPALTGTPTAPTASPGTNTTQISTTAFVAAAVAAAKEALYPVGSIYTNATNNTNPATLLGFGTWTAFGAGRVPVGFDSGDSNFNSAEKTGGSKDAIVVDHTHSATSTSTVTDPGHRHSYGCGGGGGTGPAINSSSNASTLNTNTATTGITVATSTTIANTGSSGTNANLQPYITVYMWKRTA